MDKSYLQKVFEHARSGYVYQYTGEVPNSTNVSEFVTSRYVELSGDNRSPTIVSWSNVHSCVFLYTPYLNESIVSEFEFIDDLTPPPAPVEPEVIEEPSANTDSEIISE